MGFYGNITNTARTTFQFDKIYPSRFEMDALCASDGIYNGRYVLIEYDTNLDEQNYQVPFFIVQKNGENTYIYATTDSKTTYTQEEIAQIYGAELFKYAWDTNATSFFNYFNGNAGAIPLNAGDLEDYFLIYLQKGHVYQILNNDAEFVLFNRDGQYRNTDFVTFTQVMDWSNGAAPNTWTQESVMSGRNFNETYFNEHGAYWVYIANGVCRPPDISIWDNHPDQIWLPGFVKAGRRYDYNIEGEFWQVDHSLMYQHDNINFYAISKLSTVSDNYTTNFNKDKEYYKTSRGYDSTVWQKAIVNGIERYVMIAELNTVVPTFGITADPPSLLPINPHWGTDSTNVYYDLHWQPQWGFRVKAADFQLTTPTLDPSGEMYIYDDGNIQVQNQYGRVFLRDVSRDATLYPSDESVTWKSSFEDKTQTRTNFDLYYDIQTGTWGNDSAKKVPAAIYYNKAGFDSSVITYSEDLIDNTPSKMKYGLYRQDLVDSLWQNTDTINLTSTGLSGNIYNRHDGIYGKKAQVDTQELSIMLPSIGNILASVWDIVYGGRDTTTDIRITNKRNKDISWENGTDYLYRLGLRLRGNDNQYNTNAVETLAGCINTAHDLFGMIIVPKSAQELQDTSLLSSKKIYYNTDTGEYYRKHTTYNYIPLEEEDFQYLPANDREQLNTAKIHNGCYYINVLGNYINVIEIDDPEDPLYEYNPDTTYYYKTVQNKYTLASTGTLTTFPHNGYEWFIDTDGEANNLLKANYIKNPVFQENKQYYKVTVQPVEVGSDFEPNKYFYKQNNEYVLEESDTPITAHEPYYNINDAVFTNRLSDFYFEAVYIPGKYYYKDEATGNYLIDNSADGRNIRQYGEIDYEGNLERRKCYILKEPVIRQDTTGENVLYKYVTFYSPVYDVTSQTYIPGFYYTQLGSGQYTKALGEFDPTAQYYTQEIQYIKLNPDDTSYEVDTDTVYFIGSMCVYRDDTYFLKRYNPEHTKIIGYTCLSLQYINDNFASLDTANIYIVGSYPPIQEDPYNGLPGYLRVQDGIPYRTLSNVIFIESYKKTQDPTYEPLIYSVNKFYYADTYHYITPEGSYILDKKPIQSNVQYCLITQVDGPQTSVSFFESEEYYYKLGDQYIRIEDYDPEEYPEVYSKSGVYVYEDNMNKPDERLELGQEWNVDALSIPAGITLASRESTSELVRMPNYAIQESTINGYFLDIAHILENGDRLTRDDGIVAGTINKVRDLIARFNHLRSRELVLVDDVGRVHTAPVETLQINSLGTKVGINEYDDCIERDVYPQVATLAAMEKQWISVNVDGDVSHPQITVHHNFQSVTNAPTTYNINNNTTVLSSNTAGSGTNEYSTDNIELYIPIVDEMGHVVGNQNKTLTLPYDFKELRTNGVGTNTVADTYLTSPTNLTTNTGTIIAENAQDYFRIDSYDPWILTNAAQNGHTLQIAHKVSTAYKTLTALSGTDILIGESDNVNHFNNYVGNPLTFDYNDSEVNTNKPLVSWYYTFDKAGHVKTQTATSITLPYSWKVIEVSNTPNGVTDLNTGNSATSITPIETVDTLKFNASNKWIKLFAEDDTNDNHIIYLGHLVQAIPATTSSYDFNTGAAFASGITADFSIVTDSFDEAGHQISKATTSYKLPYTWQRISVSAASAVETGTIGQVAASYRDADTLLDNFTFTPGNRYITFALDSNAKSITIGHAGAGAAASKSGNHTTAEVANSLTATAHQSSILTPRVNGTFKVPYLTIDAVGHVSYLGEDTIQIPGYTVNNVAVNDSLTLNGSTIDLKPMIWAAFGDDDNNSNLDSLKLYRINSGNLPVGVTAAFLDNGNNVYYNLSSAVSLLTEDSNANIISNRLQVLNKTDNYATTNTLAELATIQFQRTQLLTDVIEALSSSINIVEISSASNDINHLKVIESITQTNGLLSYTTKTLAINMEDVDGLNTALGDIEDNIGDIQGDITSINSSVYIEEDIANNVEEKTVTVQELTTRVALLESLIRRIVANDLTQQQLEELLEWPAEEEEPAEEPGE